MNRYKYSSGTLSIVELSGCIVMDMDAMSVVDRGM